VCGLMNFRFQNRASPDAVLLRVSSRSEPCPRARFVKRVHPEESAKSVRLLSCLHVTCHRAKKRISVRVRRWSRRMFHLFAPTSFSVKTPTGRASARRLT